MQLFEVTVVRGNTVWSDDWEEKNPEHHWRRVRFCPKGLAKFFAIPSRSKKLYVSVHSDKVSDGLPVKVRSRTLNHWGDTILKFSVHNGERWVPVDMYSYTCEKLGKLFDRTSKKVLYVRVQN